MNFHIDNSWFVHHAQHTTYHADNDYMLELVKLGDMLVLYRQLCQWYLQTIQYCLLFHVHCLFSLLISNGKCPGTLK